MEAFPLPAGVKYGYAEAFGTRPGDHHGTDIFADRGTLVLAVAAGDVRKAVDRKGGNVVYLTARDGSRYYYAHLDEWIGDYPRAVVPGEPLGTVGTSGNAEGRPPHLHFQISTGGQIVNPYPELKRVDPKVSGAAPLAAAAGPLVGSSAVIIALVLYWWSQQRRG